MAKKYVICKRVKTMKLYLDDIDKVFTHIIKKTPKLPAYSENSFSGIDQCYETTTDEISPMTA